MRGRFRDQGTLFSYISPESRVPADHPLRQVRRLVREILKQLSQSFSWLYASEGRPSVPPEQLLSALLLHGTMRKTKHRGIAGVAGDFLLNLIGYNLIRLPRLIAG